MKRIYNYLLIFLIALCFSLFSCSQAYYNPVTIGTKTEYKISVASENNSVSFESRNARTITPDNLTYSSNLDFYMWGSNLLDDSQQIDLQQIYISSEDSNKPSEGSFKFSFERQLYKLNLAAVPHNTPFAIGRELLSSSILIDLRTCNDIKFILSTRTVKGKGSAEIGFYADNWTVPAGYSLTAGIYNKTNDSPIIENIIGAFPTYNGTPLTPIYQLSKDNIDSGTYKLKLVFNKILQDKTISFSYTDDIIIYPNQNTTAFIPIPNIIVSQPNAPTYLISGYVDNLTGTSDLYDVEFCWDDKSYNEEDFLLEIIDISGAGPGTYNSYIAPLIDAFSAGNLTQPQIFMNSNWDDVKRSVPPSSYQKYSRSYFENSNVKTDGSFTSNSVYAVIKLLYGKRYIARISAVNSAGNSDYTYLDLYNTGNRSFTPTNDINFTPQNWTTDASSMNRYKIEYYYTNGSFLDDTTAENVTNTVSASAISTQSRTTNYNILNPINYNYSGSDTATLKYLYNGNYYPWEKWKNDSAAGTDYYLSDYNGFENLFLYAYYGNDVIVTDLELILKADDNEYYTSDIVISAHPASATSLIPFQQDTDISNTVTNHTITVSKSTYKYLNLLINKTNNVYSSSIFQIAKQGGQGLTIPTLSTAYYGTSYNYGQIDITQKDSKGNDLFINGETYNLFITSILNGSTINYQIYLKIEA